MSALADLLHYVLLAVVALFVFYLAVRLGTLAVLQSITQFRRRQQEGQ